MGNKKREEIKMTFEQLVLKYEQYAQTHIDAGDYVTNVQTNIVQELNENHMDDMQDIAEENGFDKTAEMINEEICYQVADFIENKYF
jgi:hypothetical protein